MASLFAKRQPHEVVQVLVGPAVPWEGTRCHTSPVLRTNCEVPASVPSTASNWPTSTANDARAPTDAEGKVEDDDGCP